MKKCLFLMQLVLLSVQCVAQQSVKLDDIQYHFTNAALSHKARSLWELVFKARQVHDLNERDAYHSSERLMLSPNQPTLQFKQVAGTNPDVLLHDLTLRYGFSWLAIGTKNLRKTTAELAKLGCKVTNSHFQLPTEPSLDAVLMTTPDSRSVVLIQRDDVTDLFAIDHVQLMVRQLELTMQFFQDLLGATLLSKENRSACLLIGEHKLILSEPEALGWMREEVATMEVPKNDAIDVSLGFLCEDLEPIYYAIKAHRLRTLSEPKNIVESDRAYISCVVLSPDNLPIELKEEDERDWKNTTVKRTIRLK